MLMLFEAEGEKYNFALEKTDGELESDLSILAIDKKTKLCSSINNLNFVLSNLNISYQDYRFVDSSWILPNELADALFYKARNLLSDKGSLLLLETQLDLDREKVSGKISTLNEGKLNNFLVFLMDSNSPNYQEEILNFV
jgi:hypothetical protein